MDKETRLRALDNQINRLQRRIEELEQLSNRFSWMRLAVVGLGVVTSGIVFFLGYAQFFWVPLLLTILVFAIIVRFHRRLEHHLARYRIWANLKRTQIARARLDWENMPPPSFRPNSALELDLDLTGRYSLHRLLDTAVSSGGRRRLVDWLATAVPVPDATLQRQQLVRELLPMSLFRGKLILNGTLAGQKEGDWEPEDMLNWLQDHQVPGWLPRWLLILAILALLNISLFLLNFAGLIPPLWQGTFLLYVVLFMVRSHHTGEPFRESLQMRDALEQLVTVFGYLETYAYHQKSQLKKLCATFLDPARRPTQHLKRINRVVNATGIRGNPFFWIALNALVPWDYFFAYRLAKDKAAIAGLLPEWLDVWFELEALSSLANIAYLNPLYTFPKINDDRPDQPGVVLQAVKLGHPLIPDNEKVCNDFSLETMGAIDIFTGSNMSGKSTFLRSVGINLVLAQAGGPVNAEYLETRPWRLHTCIKITDSVTDGISYFYAEVKCLKGLLDALEAPLPLPLFFLIDEIFRGTNNRERLLGSRAYIQALAGKNGAGLVATHDLELIQLADELPRVKNYHFRDDVSNGRMVFDYTLYAGPSPTTNALRIMRMEGLPV